MRDLVIPPGPGLPHGLVIADADLIERYSRSSGPGGQGVNTTDSRVQLSFDIAAASGLDAAQRVRLLRRLGPRLDGTVLTIDASEFRSQLRNRDAARRRLAALLADALAPPPPPRRATRPSRASIDRRLAGKRHRSELKRRRSRPGEE